MGRWGYITPDPEIEEAPVTSIVKQFRKICQHSSLEQTVKLLYNSNFIFAIFVAYVDLWILFQRVNG